MEREKFEELIRPLEIIFGRLNEEKKEIYYKALKDLTVEQLEKAVKRTIEERVERYFPLPGEIIEILYTEPVKMEKERRDFKVIFTEEELKAMVEWVENYKKGILSHKPSVLCHLNYDNMVTLQEIAEHYLEKKTLPNLPHIQIVKTFKKCGVVKLSGENLKKYIENELLNVEVCNGLYHHIKHKSRDIVYEAYIGECPASKRTIFMDKKIMEGKTQ